MRLTSMFLSLLPLASAIPQATTPSTFIGRVVFTPPSTYTDPRVLYARTAQLPNGDILATWENYSKEPPPVYFPVYRSSDNGYTWKEISRVQDQGYGWGLRYQPHIYVLPEKFAEWPAGTVLVSGSSIPTDLSKTQIDLYASTDSGVTWKFVSHIAAGGEARPTNGLTPVWEPFLMLYKSKLICYYSDQRDSAHGQKMVHQSSSDGKNWGAVVNDVAYSKYTDRPGMPTVAQLPNGKFIMAYEYGGGPAITSSYQFPVYFRVAADPEKFGAATGVSIKTTDGTVPNGSPYIVWSPIGGVNGTLIVSSGTAGDIYLNNGQGEGAWRKVTTQEGTSYTRHLRVLKGDGSKLLIMGGGKLPPSTTNKITVTVMDISKS